MVLFLVSCGNKYILVVVDYVSKSIEEITCKNNDSRVVIQFLKKNIFSRFATPRAIISDEVTHFYNREFDTFLTKYGSDIRQQHTITLKQVIKSRYQTQRLKALWRKLLVLQGRNSPINSTMHCGHTVQLLKPPWNVFLSNFVWEVVSFAC